MIPTRNCRYFHTQNSWIVLFNGKTLRSPCSREWISSMLGEERETNKMQLIWCLLSNFYLNMFRASLCPSSGEQECALPHIPETCWDKSLIINIRLVASCWFLSVHPTFMMHGHKSLKSSVRCSLILVLYRPVMAQAFYHHPLTEETRVLIMGFSMWGRWKKWQKEGIFPRVIRFPSVRIVPDGTIVYILTCLLTYSMVQSPSWEANWFAASQEIPRIFMEPEGSLPHSQASSACECFLT